jgi:hypothetical protein
MQNGIWDGDEQAHTGWNVYLLQLDDNGLTLNVISESPAQDDGFYAFTPQMMSQNKFRPGKCVLYMIMGIQLAHFVLRPSL